MVDGSSPSEGRVEIYHDGEWGTVCDDGWDMPDANVVCGQLGYASATSASATFSQGTGPIFLDEVACTADDQSLVECSHRGWNVHDCGHTEDAGVICSTSPAPGNIYLPAD